MEQQTGQQQQRPLLQQQLALTSHHAGHDQHDGHHSNRRHDRLNAIGQPGHPLFQQHTAGHGYQHHLQHPQQQQPAIHRHVLTGQKFREPWRQHHSRHGADAGHHHRQGHIAPGDQRHHIAGGPARTATHKDQTDSQGCQQLQQHCDGSSQAGHDQKLDRYPQDHSSRLSAHPQEVSRCEAQAHPQHDHPQADGDQWSTKPDEQWRVQQRQQRSQQRPERKQRGESLEGHHRPAKHSS